MEELLQKYAKFLVQDCLKLKRGQPLLVAGNILIKDFMEQVKSEALLLGASEVILQISDSYLKRELLLQQPLDECFKHPEFDRHFYNEIAKKDGAFLSLASPIPHIFEGISADVLSKMNAFLNEQTAYFRARQEKGEVAWCIAAAANDVWAKEILGEERTEEDLWKIIWDICEMQDENPRMVWEEYFTKINKYCTFLKEMQIKSLHYTSQNGTDLVVELPNSYQFQSAKDSEIIVNMPSLEVFATPSKYGVNGIVYSSKPLYYSGVEIIDFWFRFQNGKVVDLGAKKNQEMLIKALNQDEGASYLGEVALVDYDSKINQSGILFETTLYDENACCHLALGRGFAECFLNGLQKSKEELLQFGMNDSKIHIDFMIGTRDLKIVATLQDGSQKVIMENGKLVLGGLK